MMHIEFIEHNAAEIYSALRARSPVFHSREPLLPILTFRSHDAIDRGRYDFKVGDLTFHRARIDPWDYHPDDVRYDPNKVGRFYHCSDYYVETTWN